MHVADCAGTSDCDWRPGAHRTRSRSARCRRVPWSKSWTWRPSRAPSPPGGPRSSCAVLNLTDNLADNVRPLLEKLQAIADREPSADKVYALSELAFLGGKRVERNDKRAAPGPLRRGGPARLRLSVRPAVWPPRAIPTIPSTAAPAICTTAPWNRRCGSCAPNENSCRGGDEDDQHGVGRLRHDLRAARQPLAAGRLRALRVRLGLRGHGTEEPVPHARTGRAADRRPPAATKGEPVGAKFYPPGLSFPVTALLRPLGRDRPADRPARRHTINACWSSTIR